MSDIPPIAKGFIEAHIESLEALEVLLLFRNEPDREWSAVSVSRKLALNETAVASRLEQIKSAGFIADHACAGGFYRYSPSTANLATAVNELAKAYATYPFGVTRLIFSRRKSKIRTLPDP